MKQKIFNFKKKQELSTELVGKADIREHLKPEILSKVDSRAMQIIPYTLALELCVLPTISEQNEKLEILCLSASKELEQKLNFILNGQKFRLKEWQQSPLREAIFRAYKGRTDELQQLAEKFSKNAANKNPEIKEINFHLAKSDSAKFLIALIEYAYAQEASDIHFIPEREGFRIKLRKDGEFLIQQETINDHQVYKQIIQRIKALANLDLSKSHLPQDGSFSLNILDTIQNVRVSSMPTIHGEKMVLRIFHNNSVKNLSELGFSQAFIDDLKSILNKSTGLIIVCGSTGSGKTSTLYALVKECNAWQRNIVSLEDPVEQEIAGVTQTAINSERNLTFATGLKAILRQDPDVILIGEMRDPETFKIALEASYTGHLILTSIHGQTLDDIKARFEGAGIEANKLNQSLSLMISQKLLPKLCQKCRVIDASTSALLNHKVFKALGCKACSETGYSGRKLLWEAYGPSFSERQLKQYSYHNSAFEALKNGELNYQQIRDFGL